MLVLKRKLGESVTITTTVGTIVITVFRERWGKIDLAIEAPREMEIARTELIKKKESKEASNEQD